MLFLFTSPLGNICYDWDGRICSRVRLDEQPQACTPGDDPVSNWLRSYFAGQAGVLPPLAPPKTPFQQKMRQGLLEIPAGETRTYGELAKRLGTSPRAMGQALGANPLPLLIPCHRVVAATGLGGFSDGLEWKKRLLALEGARRGRTLFSVEA